MLSVEQFQKKLNAPFEEGRDEPTRCYSRRDAEALRRQAYHFLCPFARASDDDPRPDAEHPESEPSPE
jgi:hypothetical protein